MRDRTFIKSLNWRNYELDLYCFKSVEFEEYSGEVRFRNSANIVKVVSATNKIDCIFGMVNYLLYLSSKSLDFGEPE